MRLLVAENDDKTAELIQFLCEKNNYKTDLVNNVKDAYEYAHTMHYDGIISNMDLFNKANLHLINTLRNQDNMTPILMLIPGGDIDKIVASLDAGADDCICKPFVSSELLSRIRAMLRRSHYYLPDIMEFHDIKYNRSTYDLIGSDRSIRLVGKESQVMELLIRHPRQIATSEQMLTQLWGYDTNKGTDNLWVYVSNLRKKIGSLSSIVKIKVIRGIGYCLDDQTNSPG